MRHMQKFSDFVKPDRDRRTQRLLNKLQESEFPEEFSDFDFQTNWIPIYADTHDSSEVVDPESLRKYKDYLAAKTDTAISYKDYLADNIDAQIEYSKYIADPCKSDELVKQQSIRRSNRTGSTVQVSNAVPEYSVKVQFKIEPASGFDPIL